MYKIKCNCPPEAGSQIVLTFILADSLKKKKKKKKENITQLVGLLSFKIRKFQFLYQNGDESWLLLPYFPGWVSETFRDGQAGPPPGPSERNPPSFLHLPPVRERSGRLARSLCGQLTIQRKLVPGACGPAPTESITNTTRSVLLGVKAQHEDQELLKQRPHGHDRSWKTLGMGCM